MQLVNQHFQIGAQVFDGGTLTLSGPQGIARLPLKAAQVLVVLAESPGQTVTRDRLLDRVWANQLRTPDVLTQVIVELRRALSGGAATLVTVTKVGYRLQAEVGRLDAPRSVAISTGEPAPVVSAPQSATQTATGDRVAPAWRWLGTAMFVSICLSCTWLLRPHTPVVAVTEPDRLTLHEPLIELLTADPAAERWPALAPDASRVAWSRTGADGRRQILLQVPGDSAAMVLAPDPDADQVHPVWSPDGREVAFLSYTKDGCQLRAVAAAGHSARVLRPCIPGVLTWFQWAADQTLYTSFMRRGAPGLHLHRQDLDSDRDVALVYPHRGYDHDAEPELSPDGRYLAFRRGRVHAQLHLLDLQRGQLQQVTAEAALLAGHTWLAPQGLLIYATDAHGAFELVAYDPATARHQRLGVAPARHPQAARRVAMLSFERPRRQTELWSVPLSGSHPASAFLPASTGSDRLARPHPDGKQLAFVSDRSGSDQVWIRHEDALPQQWSRFRDHRIRDVSWHPDGRSLLVVLSSASGWSAVVLDLATRREQPAPAPPGSVRMLQWYSAGQRLLAVSEIDGVPHLVVLARHGDRWGVEWQLAGVNRVAAADDGRLWLTMEGRNGLYVLQESDREPVHFSSHINLINQDAWVLHAGNIWYIDWSQPTALMTLQADGSARKSLDLTSAGLPKTLLGELSIGGGRALLTVVSQDQTDVALARW